MPRYVPWLLVALCFVAGRRQPLDQRHLCRLRARARAAPSARTAAQSRWSTASPCWSAAYRCAARRLDRRSLRPARAHRVRHVGGGARDASAPRRRRRSGSSISASAIVMGFGGACVSRRAERLAARPLVPGAAARRGARRRLVGDRRRRHLMIPLAEYMIVAKGWRHAYLVFAIVSAVFMPVLLVLPWRRIEPRCARHCGDRAPACGERRRSDGRRGDPRMAVLGAHLLVRADLDRHLLDRAAGHGLPARARPGRRATPPARSPSRVS